MEAAEVSARGEPSITLWSHWHAKRHPHLRADPRVSITVMDVANWSAHVSLQGSVVSIEEDVGLVDIDRIARHYMGNEYPIRDHRRSSAWIEIDTWHAWRPESIP